ncbi:M23 family metallopeptidase, partial [Stella sp.]|uniref:M23 family metallopeptidase n=1 Tax=Stella sp. TaxID=2912054 RepID=UPI0035B46597
VRVKPRDRVTAGQPVGLVGLSGKTEFPHVHITVRQGSTVVDPFVGLQAGAECQIGREPLWTHDALAALPYKPGAVHIAGIVAGRPDIQKARAGELREATARPDAEALIVWAEVYNVVTGDVLSLRLFAPDGKLILDAPRPIEKDQARVFRSAGRKLPPGGWPRGTYRAEIAYLRDGKPVWDPVRSEITVR